MRRVLLATALFLYALTLNAQTKNLDCMQGIWESSREDNLIEFSIQNGFNVLSIGYESDGSGLGFYESVVVFFTITPTIREWYITAI